MSFLCETPEATPAAPAVVTQQADPLFRDAFSRILSRADVEAGRPYQPYGQQRIADLTPDTLSSFNLTRQNVGAYQPFVGLAGAQAAQAGQSLSQRNLSDYMNPYTQNVVDIAKREAIRGDDIQRQQRNYMASKAGAFGGSRQGIVEAEAQRNLGQRLDDIQQQGLSAAYDKALNAINMEAGNQTRSAAVLGELGGATQRLGAADATALDTIGTRQQQQTQAGLDLAYKDFLAQRDYDKDQVKFLSSILAGAPQQASSNQTETTRFTPQASPIAQAAGLGTAGLSLYGLYKTLFNEGGDVRGIPETPIGAGGGLPNLDPRELIKRAALALKRRGVPATPANVQAEVKRMGGGESWAPEPTGEPLAEISKPPVVNDDLRIGTGAMPDITLANAPRQEKPAGLSIPEPPAVGGAAPTTRMPTLADMGPIDVSAPNKLPTPAEARAGVKAREAKLLEGDNTPAWIMPVLRAGLAMMQAKPGQSALAGIGAGGEAGLEQAMKDKAERQKIEAENQRRRERAEDLTMREQEAAATDATRLRDDAFKQIGAQAQARGLTLQEFQARLDAAVKGRQLSNEGARLALAGYEAQLKRAELQLSERRTDQQGRYYDTLAGQGARTGFQTLYNPETKQTIFHDPSKGAPPAGFQPVGALRGEDAGETRRLRISTEAGKRVMADPNYLGMDEAAKNRAFSNMYRQVEREMYGSDSGGTMGSGPPPLVLPPKK